MGRNGRGRLLYLTERCRNHRYLEREEIIFAINCPTCKSCAIEIYGENVVVTGMNW